MRFWVFGLILIRALVERLCLAFLRLLKRSRAGWSLRLALSILVFCPLSFVSLKIYARFMFPALVFLVQVLHRIFPLAGKWTSFYAFLLRLLWTLLRRLLVLRSHNDLVLLQVPSLTEIVNVDLFVHWIHWGSPLVCVSVFRLSDLLLRP